MTITREQWLSSAARWAAENLFLTPDLPATFRITCGWPHKGGTAKKKRTVGECWRPECSQAGVHEILISPYLADPVEVLTTVVHEMVHAAVGVEHQHKKPFIETATRVGLVPPWTSTPAGFELIDKFKAYLGTVPPYPHKTLDSLLKAGKEPKEKKTQPAALCGSCGYTFRVAKKWAELGLPPQCICGGVYQLQGGEA
jgi:hypothetical protein